MGVVARRYIDFIILLIPTLVSAHFCSIPTFYLFMFFALVIMFSCSINTYTGDYGRLMEAI